jgi:hypothetical protein
MDDILSLARKEPGRDIVTFCIRELMNLHPHDQVSFLPSTDLQHLDESALENDLPEEVRWYFRLDQPGRKVVLL